MTFFVYHGYVTPDNCDASEGSGPYALTICKTVDALMRLRSEPIFRIIEGREMDLSSSDKVVTWTLKEKT